MKEEDLGKIESKEAREEFEARHLVAKDDESRIIKKELKKFNRLYNRGTNWACYNWILSTVSFKGVTDVAQGMRLMYEYLWGYLKTYDLTVQQLRNYMIEHEIGQDDPAIQELLKQDMPIDMCETALKKITEAARSRAKLKSYKVEVEKRDLGNAEL